jgi:shikimate kinase
MAKGKLKAKSAKPKVKSESSSVVITGFMGTGKTTVGRIVANKLEREFVDMDNVIAAKEGRSIREIFQTRGEDYFRARESELCSELASRTNLVIATGGGALIDAGNRERFRDAFVVCLDANAAEIIKRLDGNLDRPLVAGDDPAARIEQLLSARQAAYARVKTHVDTDARSPVEVAEEIVSAFQEAVG